MNRPRLPRFSARSAGGRRLGAVVGLVFLIVALGWPWGALQAVAWATMVVRYAQAMPLLTAVGHTLDGRHPCTLCVLVQKGRAQSSQSDRQLPGQGKLDVGLVWQGLTWNDAPETEFHPGPVWRGSSSRTHAPPKPPPR